MKTMKTVLMVLLGAALVLSMAGVVGAANPTVTEDTASQKQTTVTVTVNGGYTLTIPAQIDGVALKDVTTPTVTSKIALNNTVIPNGGKVLIKVSQTNGNTNNWTLINTGLTSEKVQYQMYYSGTTITSFENLETKVGTTDTLSATKTIATFGHSGVEGVTALTKETGTDKVGYCGAVHIAFQLTETPNAAGTYSGSVTIEAAYEAPAAATV